MKKFISILVIGIFFLSGLGASALQNEGIKPALETNNIQEISTSSSPRDYTHTVLVEVGTATWCPSCPASNTAWHSIYGSGNYDFEYTELVYDKNAQASARFSEFNPKYVPTSYWDGGQFVFPGTNTATFYSYLDSSGARAVPDLVSDLSVTWLGSAQMQISYSVLNNEATNYPGRLRIYVIELQSTLWNDYNGNPYYHAFLNFAKNQVINIPAGGTISDTFVWDGAAVGYPGVTQNNLQVILAVFGNTPHQSYSDPPSGNPFTAYYSDECIAALPQGSQNNPPETPTINGPTKGKAGVEYDYIITTTDPDGDNVYYCIDWGDGSGEVCIGPYASGEEVTASHTWTEDGTYTIKVKARDIYDAESEYATLKVSIPRSKFYVNILFQRFFERFEYLFTIARLLLNN